MLGAKRTMKITAQEEYGLRCALQLALVQPGGSLTIPDIAEREGLSAAYAGKLLALMRRNGLVRSVRGRSGGYALARPIEEISIAEVLRAFGSRPWHDDHCSRHAGVLEVCVHAAGCSVRSLWGSLDLIVDRLFSSITLADLVAGRLPGAGSPAGDGEMVVLSAEFAVRNDKS